MSNLNYDVSAIELPSLAPATALLDSVDTLLEEVAAEKNTLEQKILAAKEAQKAEGIKITKLSDVARKAKSVLSKKDTTEELYLQLELLEEYKRNATGELLVEAGELGELLSDECEAYAEPFYPVMSLVNADATDAVVTELSNILVSFISRYNSLLEETGWFDPLKVTQPKHNGQELKQLTIGMGEALVTKGKLLKELITGGY